MTCKGMFLSLAVFIGLLNVCTAIHDTTLVMLQIVHRHGIRTPVNIHPAENYNEAFWVDFAGGLGQLTPAGLKQHYDFGQFIKANYTDFLTQPYSPSRVYVRSTDYDRALMSAYAMITGLYPAAASQQWSIDHLKWYPIPVHTNDKALDPVLRYSADCPRYAFLKAQSQKTVEYLKIQNDNIDFIKMMSNYSGITDLGLYTMWKVADNYMVENALNLAMPQWVTGNKDKILALNDYNFLFDYYTMEMAQLIGGAVLYDMAKNFNDKISSGNKRELFVYSAHDTYIAALHKLFGFTNPIVQPNFASALFFELRKRTNNTTNSTEYFIRVLHKNNVDNTPIQLDVVTISGCTELCPLSEFLKVNTQYGLKEFTAACQKSNTLYPDFPPEKNYSALEVGLIISTSVLALAVVSLFILLICRVCVCKQGFRKYIL